MAAYLIYPEDSNDDQDYIVAAAEELASRVHSAVLHANSTDIQTGVEGKGVQHADLGRDAHVTTLLAGSSGPVFAYAPLSVLLADTQRLAVAEVVAQSAPATLIAWGTQAEYRDARLSPLRKASISFEALPDGTLRAVGGTRFGPGPVLWPYAEPNESNR